MWFTAFFGKKGPFQWMEQILKLSPMRWKMGASLCTPLRPFKNEMKENFYHKILSTVDVHLYKNISLPHYRVPRKTVKFVPIVPKAHSRANVCVHQKSIKPCNF